MTGQPPGPGDWGPGAPEPSPFGPGGDQPSSEPGQDDPRFDQPAFDEPGFQQPHQGPPGAWSGGDQQAFGQPYGDHGHPYGPGTNPYQYGYQSYSRSSQATVALVLSLAGLFCCGIGAIIGAAMGKAEMNAIDRGEADPSQRGIAQAAFVIGLVIIGLHAIPFLMWVVSALLAGSSLVAP